MPAREKEQAAFFETLGKSDGFPAKVDWQVAIDGIDHADQPNFEANLPKYNESLDLSVKYREKWSVNGRARHGPGGATLKGELQAIWDR